jgi:hypothetical protein
MKVTAARRGWDHLGLPLTSVSGPQAKTARHFQEERRRPDV